MNRLSKTAFLQSLQCPKLLWHSIHKPNLIPPPDESIKARMEQGKKVETYARQLFPQAVVIDHEQPFDDVIAQSQDALLRPTETAICNALLSTEDLMCETDILVPAENAFDLYEVKSSTSLKPEHLPDIAFQKHVAEKKGVRIRSCFLVLVNGAYVRKGDIEPKKLFQVNNITDGVSGYADIDAQVESALEICRQKKCPEIDIGEQCASDCPLRDLCWKKVDSIPNNIFSLYRIQKKRAFGWYRDGIIDNADIPEDYPLNDRQKMQVKAEKDGQLQINRKQVTHFLNQLKFPLYFLDFETFASPIPLIDNSSPYHQIPFQYSLHVIEKNLNDKPKHFSWIWDSQVEQDPRKEMLIRLKELLGGSGSILAYYAIFEKMILKQAVAICPDYDKWLAGILKRFVDLLLPFRNFYIYHPNQHGSCSLKSVLPALTGQDYSKLAIQDGKMASRQFMAILNGDIGGSGKERILKELEAYCGLDTMAMVEIMRKMKGYLQNENAERKTR
jgi:hypothetical protein